MRSGEPRPAIYENRIWKCMSFFWLLTVAAAFEDGAVLKIRFPGIGALYGLRIFLAASAVTFVVWAIRYRVRLWHDSSTLERWACLFAAVMIVYGALSLPRAISFEETFRMLFNLVVDMVFFCLLLQICHDEVLRRRTLALCAVCLGIILLLGVYEVFFSGIVKDMYDLFPVFPWLGISCQPPVVFANNTNDYASGAVFLFIVLTVNGILWRCDTKKNVLLTLCVTAVLFFLNRAAGARLCFFAYCVFLAGTALASVLKKTDKKRTLLCIGIALLCIFCIMMAERVSLPGVGQAAESVSVQSADAPSSLADEFFETNPETGEKILRQYDSAGVRARLLLHCFDCIRESRGLGVGLGNTGKLAEERAVAIMYLDIPYGSMHCFIARVLADYGIFAAVPMIAIAFLMLKAAFAALRRAVRTKDTDGMSRVVLFLCALLTYPILSTAPSDAQDIIPMWIFLGLLVWQADRLNAECSSEEGNGVRDLRAEA